MKYFFIIIQLFLSTVIDAQIITTASGNGLPGDTGDSGPATSAKIDYPTLNVFDAQGNYYFTENSNKVRKVTPDGIISTIAGTGIAGFAGDSGLATSAKLNGPIGIGIDKIGNIYINDCQNNRIRKIDATTGIITTYAGNGTAGFSGDSGLATAASINGAADVACDTFGNVYISDHGNNRIRKVDTAGIITTVAGNGIGAYGGTGGRADTTKISLPVGITCDLTGNLYFVEGGCEGVRKVDMHTGIITTVAGNRTIGFSGDSGPAISAQFYAPLTVAVDAIGDLYIADKGNERVRKVDTNGIINTIVGTGVAGYNGDGGLADTSQLYYPEGVAVDACGNVYIADFVNNRIRKITYPPTPIALINDITGSTTDTICGAMTVTFTATAAASSGVVTYQWYVNGSALSTTGSTYTYTPASGDSIRCVATAVNACTAATASSNTINMVVNIVTTPTITITAPAAAAAGSVVSVNATVAGPASYSIRWYNNGVLFNTTTVPMVTYTKGAGVDNITATVVASEGCYDSSMSGVAIVTATTETSPSFGSAQDRLEVLRTYPNPVHNLLYVAISNSPLGRPGGISYRLMSMVGSVMREGVLKEGDNMMWVEQIPVGVYMLEVVNGDGGKTVRKIVKE